MGCSTSKCCIENGYCPTKTCPTPRNETGKLKVINGPRAGNLDNYNITDCAFNIQASRTDPETGDVSSMAVSFVKNKLLGDNYYVGVSGPGTNGDNGLRIEDNNVYVWDSNDPDRNDLVGTLIPDSVEGFTLPSPKSNSGLFGLIILFVVLALLYRKQSKRI